MKFITILLTALTLSACGPQPRSTNEQDRVPLVEMRLTNFDLVQLNREKYAKDIREATKECLVSVRSNPQVQNYNDDNEIVETCTEYAMKVYNACYDMNGVC